MKRIGIVLAIGSLGACASLPEKPTTSTAQGQDPRTEFVALLAGEFDSREQMRADEAAGIADGEKHGWVNRRFFQVDAPKVGEYVLVGSTRYNGPPWLFDRNEYLVWTVEPGPAADSFVMAPRRFVDLDNMMPLAGHPDALAGFAPIDLQPAISGAACDIVWTRSEYGFSGASKPCNVESTTVGGMLEWSWTFELETGVLWIAFSGHDANGELKDGSPTGKPYRLDKL